MNQNLKHKGFSLMEVLVSIIIIASTVAVVMPNISATMYMTHKAKTMVTAVQLARNLINEIQLENKISVTSEDGKFEDFEDYRYEYVIEKVNLMEILPQDEEKNKSKILTGSKSNNERLFKVQILVFWDAAGREQTYETNSYLFSEKKK
ncbi:MAG: type II secretion system protein [Candidatus Cloacimonetes bacterium]|nr:type II secretion system protein [Candidatus Cloacimonadota bacterium]